MDVQMIYLLTPPSVAITWYFCCVSDTLMRCLWWIWCILFDALSQKQTWLIRTLTWGCCTIDRWSCLCNYSVHLTWARLKRLHERPLHHIRRLILPLLPVLAIRLSFVSDVIKSFPLQKRAHTLCCAWMSFHRVRPFLERGVSVPFDWKGSIEVAENDIGWECSSGAVWVRDRWTLRNGSLS
jgi:hypothetical protein